MCLLATYLSCLSVPTTLHNVPTGNLLVVPQRAYDASQCAYWQLTCRASACLRRFRMCLLATYLSCLSVPTTLHNVPTGNLLVVPQRAYDASECAY
ncbi:hypothetical protein DPMN_118412 [Dreissena polymorpha]|uniref:Uncharacterized protein n=1 Tax=Dreissena polymorpha TaxID=45954 RepID=A0A9D4JQ78_DREPO|nr:hypothetical protein DPMN_118412 [Dreissena polymorpha]